MMHAAVAHRTTSDYAAYAQPKVRVERNTSKMRKAAFRVTWSSIDMDGETLLDGDFDLSVSMVVEALRAAEANHKDELLVSNLAADLSVGSPLVSEVQATVETLIREACDRIGRDVPEMRLALRNNEYDLRCYVGRYMPTDFDPEA